MIYNKNEIPEDLQQYFVRAEIGLEKTPDEFVAKIVEVFREVRRVLKSDGTCWVNLGDSYAANRGYQVPDSKHVDVGNFKGSSVPLGLKGKDLVGIPWMVAFALRADGWWLRQDIIWSKPNPMPESVTDRCTKAHEYLFLLTKSAKYYYNADAIREPNATPSNVRTKLSETFGAIGQLTPVGGGEREWNNPAGRNKRSVWTMATQPTPEAHFATYPLELPETCLLAGSREGGLILDPFNGAGTTGLAALKNGRRYVGIELKPEYIKITHERFQKYMPLLAVNT